jgi:hypothetical protein
VISNFTSSTPVFDTFSTAGSEPDAAFAVEFPGQSLESLVVANSGDGVFALLGGAAGLDEEETLSNRALPEPTALALAALSGNSVEFYATTAGIEAAFTLAFILPGFTPSVSPAPGTPSAVVQAPGQLVALSETSLALVGTLLVTMLNAPTSTSTNLTLTVLNTPTSPAFSSAAGNQAEASTAFATAFASLAPSQGQSLFAQSNSDESSSSEAVETAPVVPQSQGQGQGQGQAQGVVPVAPPWARSVLSLDRLFQEIRQENRDALSGNDAHEPAQTDRPSPDEPGVPTPTAPAPLPVPDETNPNPSSSSSSSSSPGSSPVDRVSARHNDAVLEALGSGFQVPSQPLDEPALGGVAVLFTSWLIVRANPPTRPGSNQLGRQHDQKRIQADVKK